MNSKPKKKEIEKSGGNGGMQRVVACLACSKGTVRQMESCTHVNKNI